MAFNRPHMVIFLLSLLCARAPSFILRKRSIIDDALSRAQKESQLQDALKVIERERRRIHYGAQDYEDPYARGFYPWQADDAINPGSDVIDPRENELLGRLFGGEEALYEDVAEGRGGNGGGGGGGGGAGGGGGGGDPYVLPDFPDEDVAGGDQMAEMQAEGYAPNQVSVDKEELDDLFQPDADGAEVEKEAEEEAKKEKEDEKKEKEEEKEEEKKREYDPSQDDGVEKRNGALDLLGAALSQDQLNRLLDTVEKSELGALTPEEVTRLSDSEVNDMLGEEDKEEAEAEAAAAEAAGAEKPHTKTSSRMEKINGDNGEKGYVFAKESISTWPSSGARDIKLNKEWFLTQYLQGLGDAGETVGEEQEGEEGGRNIGDGISIKRKRSNWGEMRGPIIGEATVIQERDVAVGLLQGFLELEDDENSNLAKALNLATLAQVENDDSYIPDEINYLRKAIADESELKDMQSTFTGAAGEEDPNAVAAQMMLGNGEGFLQEADYEENVDEASPPTLLLPEDDDVEDIPGGMDDVEGEEDFELHPFLSYLPYDNEKREYPNEDNEESEGEDLFGGLSEAEEEQIVEEIEAEAQEEEAEEEAEAEAEVEAEEEVNRLLTEKLHELLMQAAANSVQTPEVQESNGRWLDRPVMEAEEPASKEDWELNPFLRELWRQIQEKNDMKRGYIIEEDEQGRFDPFGSEGAFLPPAEKVTLTEADICPAVQTLTDDCVFARNLGLALDSEAADLCNRHQLCYTCGSAHALSPEDCDKGYLGEASHLCHGETGCKDDAAGLFVLMVKNHAFLPRQYSPDLCVADCTYDYIAGVAGAGRK